MDCSRRTDPKKLGKREPKQNQGCCQQHKFALISNAFQAIQLVVVGDSSICAPAFIKWLQKQFHRKLL